jgi:hypothetical protein
VLEYWSNGLDPTLHYSVTPTLHSFDSVFCILFLKL